MLRRSEIALKKLAPAKVRAEARATVSRRVVMAGKGMRISSGTLRGPYLPPENWHEPSEMPRGNFSVVHQPAGTGYRHILTEEDVRNRLAKLPRWMVEPLEVVQFSQMTRKKRIAPCYGMQWGMAIYLYPIEENLVETFRQPPKPSQKIEASMFGARWEPAGRGQWRLIWSPEAIRDFYLNNVLIHELGHILDTRNSRTVDRERFAEWFAIENGYKRSQRQDLAVQAERKYVRRRHHKAR
jgi:hypothetical protein